MAAGADSLAVCLLFQADPFNRLWIMQSSGGILRVTAARRQPVHTLLSGPAAGVAGAFHAATVAGHDHVITFDMGGTSTDVSLADGAIRRTGEGSVEGWPVRVLMLDVHTVDAGGGFVAWSDAGGALRVGPGSAGCEPGPACYGRGGIGFTVSNANLLLGRLDPARFLGEVRAVLWRLEQVRNAARGEKVGSGIDIRLRRRHAPWGWPAADRVQ